MTDQNCFSIAIPIFNEVVGVYNLIEKTAAIPLKKEIIIIDDGSTSHETKEIIYAVKNKYPEIIVIENIRNIGKSQSVQKALKIASGNLFTILDGDRELDPKDIILLYDTLKTSQARLVNGTRVIRDKKNHNSYSNMLTRFAKKISGLLIYFLYGAKIKDVLSGFKLFYTGDFKNHNFSTKRFGLETELIISCLNNNRKICEVDVSYCPRSYKEGKKINIFDGIEIYYHMLTNIRIRNIFKNTFAIICSGILLSGLIFIIYTLCANASPTSDSIPNNFTAVNIIYHRRLDLTNFKPYFLKRQILHHVGVENKQGVLFAKTPVINGILASPFFKFFDSLFGMHGVAASRFLQKDFETYYQSVGKYYGTLITSISVFFIFLTVFVLFKSILYAVFAAMTYGLATAAYSTAAQGNWQHAPSLLLISISFYLFLHLLKNNSRTVMFIITVLLATATFIRIVNILFFISIMTMMLLHKQNRKLTLFSIILFVFLLLIWTFTNTSLGIPGGYNDEIIRSFRSFDLSSSLKILVSLFISPNVGLITFSPIFIFSLLGIIKLIQTCLKNKIELNKPIIIFLLTCTLCFFLLLCFNSFWWAWEGGYSWGPRLLTESIPFLVFLGAYFIYSLRDKFIKRTFYVIFFILFFYSVIVQTTGVYAYDTEWQYKYYTPNKRLEMAWYNNPNIINYYLLKRKKFFKQKLIKNKAGIAIKKEYYFIDIFSKKFELSKTNIIQL